jgi:VanZ family protein
MFWKYQFPAFMWAITIFVLSLIPRMETPPLFPHQDKVAHTAMFFVQCWLLWRAFIHQQRLRWLRLWALPLAVVVSTVYGAAHEFHQLNIPGRTADLYDAIANGTGALLFALLLVWRRRSAQAKMEFDNA